MIIGMKAVWDGCKIPLNFTKFINLEQSDFASTQLSLFSLKH